jgi:hypothetical protein
MKVVKNTEFKDNEKVQKETALLKKQTEKLKDEQAWKSIKEFKKAKKAWSKKRKETNKEATCEKCKAVLKYCSKEVLAEIKSVERTRWSGGFAEADLDAWAHTGKHVLYCPVCNECVYVPKPEEPVTFDMPEELVKARNKRRVDTGTVWAFMFFGGIALAIISVIVGMVFVGIEASRELDETFFVVLSVIFQPINYIIAGGIWSSGGIHVLLNILTYVGVGSLIFAQPVCGIIDHLRK